MLKLWWVMNHVWHDSDVAHDVDYALPFLFWKYTSNFASNYFAGQMFPRVNIGLQPRETPTGPQKALLESWCYKMFMVYEVNDTGTCGFFHISYSDLNYCFVNYFSVIYDWNLEMYATLFLCYWFSREIYWAYEIFPLYLKRTPF